MEIINIDSAEKFDEKVLKNDKVVAAFFTATWCPYCKTQYPRFQDLVAKYPDVVFCSVDVDKAEGVDDRYNVMTIPSILFFKKGEVISQNMVAYLQPHELEDYFKSVLA